MTTIATSSTYMQLSEAIALARRAVAANWLPNYNQAGMRPTQYTAFVNYYFPIGGIRLRVVVALSSDGTITETVEILAGCQANTATPD